MKEYFKKITVPIFIIIVLLVISFFTIIPVGDMIVLGAILGHGLRSIARRFKPKVKYDSLAIILAILIILIPVLLLCVYIIHVIIFLAGSFTTETGVNIINGFNLNQTVSIIVQNVPAQYQSTVQSYSSYVLSMTNEIYNWLLNYCIDIVKSIPVLFVQIFTLMFSTYYFARDGDKLMEYVRAFIPKEMESFADKMFYEIETVFKSIFYGHFLTAIIIGIIARIGFGLLDYPYAMFLAILTGICQLIPVGPWPVYCTLVIIDLINGNFVRAIVTLFFGFGLSVCDVYIRPVLAGKYSDVHSMILLLGFMAGPLVFGLIGFIIGPLIFGITCAVIKAYKEEVIEVKSEDSVFIIKKEENLEEK